MISGAHRAATIVAAEEASGELASGALMARAAAAVAHEVVVELAAHGCRVYGARVLVAVGAGNNGGDGLYAAARLARRGVRVSLWCTSGVRHEAGFAAAVAAGCRVVDAVEALEELLQVDLVVDAVLGLGARAGLPAPVATFAAACRGLDLPVLAVDLPSGVVADEVTVTESFVATATVTFGGARLCHLLEPARSRCGRVVVADIGLTLPAPDVAAFTVADLVAHVPVPGPTSHKYTRGVVGIDAGSPTYVGAGVLCATGAVHAGAGMVRFVGPKPGPVRLELPNVVASRGRVQAWVLGSGWGGRDGADAIAEALAERVPTVLDADALDPAVLPQKLRRDVVLTPHAGELARLLGRERATVEADPLGAVEEAVAIWGATVLLKGATQYVASPGRVTTVAIPGPGWTAQAGSGDVLAGMTGAMLAAGVDAPVAALCAASLQALAADRCAGPHPPQTVARALPGLIAELVG